MAGDPKVDDPKVGAGAADWPNAGVEGVAPKAGLAAPKAVGAEGVEDPKAVDVLVDPNPPAGLAPKDDWPNAEPPVPEDAPKAEVPKAGLEAAPNAGAAGPDPDEAPNEEVAAGAPKVGVLVGF